MRIDEIEAVRRRLAQLAWLLDNSIQIPGTPYRIGLDAIIGFVPGLGDVVGGLLSSYIVREAARLGTPPSVLTRMAFNVAVEGLVGMVPILGDVFDAAWKANARNLALLDAHFREPRRTVKSSRLFVAAMIAGLIGFVALSAAVTILLVRLILQAFS